MYMLFVFDFGMYFAMSRGCLLRFSVFRLMCFVPTMCVLFLVYMCCDVCCLVFDFRFCEVLGVCMCGDCLENTLVGMFLMLGVAVIEVRVCWGVMGFILGAVVDRCFHPRRHGDEKHFYVFKIF